MMSANSAFHVHLVTLSISLQLRKTPGLIKSTFLFFSLPLVIPF